MKLAWGFRALALFFALVGGATHLTSAQTPTAANTGPGAPAVHLEQAGRQPRSELRYHLRGGTSEAVVMRMRTSMAIGIGPMPARAVQMPGIRMRMNLGPIASGTNGRMRVPFEFAEVSLEGDSQASNAGLLAQMQQLVGLRGAQTIDDRGWNHGLDFTPPPGLSPDLTRQIHQLSKSLENITAAFPAEPVGVGAVWAVRNRVESSGIEIEQVTRYRLQSRDGDRLVLGIELTQRADPQPIPSPTPGVSARLDALTGSGEGTMNIDLGHVAPIAAMQSHSEMRSTVSAQGMQQPMRMEMDIDVAFETP